MRWIGLACLLAGIAPASDSAYQAARALQQASIAKQQASVRAQQAAAAAHHPSFFTASAVLSGTTTMSCEPADTAKLHAMVDEGAQRAGLDADLVRAVVRKESAFNPCATSIKGAQGLMQLMPSVQTQFGVTNPYDARQNIGAGTSLLKQLLGQYGGDLARALGAYNAGPARVDEWGGVPPFPETTQYVMGILSELPAK